MNFNIYNILMLVGAIQGVVFSMIVFVSEKYRFKSLYFLAALILCIALNNLQYFALDSKILTPTEFFGIFYVPFATLSLVLYFFYVKFYLFPNSQISLTEKLLFLPALVFFALTVFYKTILAFGLMTETIDSLFNQLIYIHESFALVYSVFLLVLIYRKIILYEKLYQNFPAGKISWLKITTIISLLLCVLYGVAIGRAVLVGAGNSDAFYLFWISQSFVIYWLGHLGIYNFAHRNDQKVMRLANSRVDANRLPVKSEYITAFQNFVVEQKNYLNSELTLDSVAEEIGLSKSYLSRMINAELCCSYTDYINSLRVEEAKSHIQNPESEKFTLMAIGFESGFNSKSTFNSAFKKFTGFTPSEFKKNLGKEKNSD